MVASAPLKNNKHLMKITGKLFIYIFIFLFILLGSALSYVKFGLPDVKEAPDLKVKTTPERLERGKYLANHVTLCVDCHSKRDWTKFAGPPLPHTLGSGGERFDESIGFPGSVYSPNITPFNLKGWTDGELYRLITTGVTKDGKAIINIMPYQAYGKMDKEDIYAIIAYIRTLGPKKSNIPERSLNFPLNFMVNTIPQEAQLQSLPPEEETVKYGAYMVNAAACVDCHTKQDKGSNIKGMEFAGGREFSSAAGSIFSTNITADKTTGIGNWSKEQFISRFKMYANESMPQKLLKGQFQTIMPWVMYAGLKEDDLAAMFTYLQTVKPINNEVIRYIQNK
jgi:cytochrome c2